MGKTVMDTTQRAGLGLGLGVAAVALGLRAMRRRRAIDFAGRTVVITGGSRGLGLVLARGLAAEGAHVILLARDAEELARAQTDIERRGGSAEARVCDVRDRHEVDAVIGAVAAGGPIDVLMNVAGIIRVGPLEHMTAADFDEAMATHFWGPLHTILAALPHMRRQGARRIVNISSIGGAVAVPHLVPYSASKFALGGLSEGLRAELASDGFRVTTVYPGLMRTGSTYRARFKGQHRREFAWFHTAGSLPGFSASAERAAQHIIEACRHGDARLVITLQAQVAVLLNAIAPGLMAAWMAAANRVLPGSGGPEGNATLEGWESVSAAAPSLLTRLGDRASARNNEQPAE
jgi:NAD(P)-dependent dehydrogenase (short-subunit alcohol dehydrogenase family)